jgi:cobalt-zinc-cadmium efflux system outer membrane protein
VKFVLIPPVLLAVLLPLRAATFSPDQAVRHALSANRDLAAARLLVAEAVARQEQSGRLSNPEVETELRPNLNGREGILALGVTQRFPLTGRLRRERAVTAAEVAAATAEVRNAERELATQVALGIADWLALEAQRQVRERQLQVAAELVAATRAAAGRGEGSQVEVRQLELEAAQLRLALRQQDRERAALATTLRPLLGVTTNDALEFTGGLPPAAALPLTDGAGNASRPDVELAGARVEIARRASELARAERWSDVGVGVVSEMQRAEDAPTGQQSDNFVGLRLSLPLPFWNRNQGRLHEAVAAAERRRLERDALVVRSGAEQAGAREQLALALATEQEFAEVLLPAARALEAETARLREQGQGGYAELARVRDQRLRLELGLVAAGRERLRTQLQLQVVHGELPHFSIAP